MKVKIGVSARHVHLCDKDFKYLFGESANLTIKSDLSQPGEYSCHETVTLKTDKNKIDNVRVLGPLRDQTQVEISRTDAYVLGLNPPVRISGDLDNSEKITLCNKDKELNLNEGCIISARHIHMSERDSYKLNYFNNQKVKVKIKGEKGAILDNVFIKVKGSYALELHLDTDDGNAMLVSSGDICEVLDDE